MAIARIGPAVLLVLVLLAAACGEDTGSSLAEPPNEPVEIEGDTGVAYMTDAEVFAVWGIEEGQTLFMERYAPVSGGPWPVVVILHGRNHESTNIAPLAKAVAERGAVVYAPNYLYDDVPTSPGQVDSGMWMGGKTVPDLSCVVATARADAVAHGGDPEHVVLAGHSLGGMLGATVALTADDPNPPVGGSGECVAPEASPPPKAFVGLEGVYDWLLIAEARPAELLEEDPNAHREVSPLSHAEPATETSPEFYLMSSDVESYTEGIYFNDHMNNFEAALTEAGYQVTATLYPGQSHAAYIQPAVMPEVVDLIIELGYG